jgi:hypothetical protein
MSTTPQPIENRWRIAAFILPRPEHMPVEVELHNGKIEQRKKSEVDWRDVRRWRTTK